MLIYSKLPISFNAAAMQQEIIGLENNYWKQHYNTKHYNGDWSIIPLKSIDGKLENNFAVHNSSNTFSYAFTPIVDSCPYIKEVITSFQCETTAIRLMKLKAGSVIKAHTDHDLEIDAGEVRLHIPIVTHKDVIFTVHNISLYLQEGSCWYLNLTLTHSVTNNSPVDRIHLVIDCNINDWLLNLLNAPNNYKAEIPNDTSKENINKNDIDKIIKELSLQGTPIAVQIIEQLKQQHNNE